MAKQLKVEDNYVVHYDTTAGEYVESFAINHCVYRENENAFIILEQIDKEILTINKADILSGAWIDGNSIAYTVDGIRTFLQQSTGFNTASGGSGANIGTENLTIDDVGLRTLRLGGGLATDGFAVRSANNAQNLLTVQGNGFVSIRPRLGQPSIEHLFRSSSIHSVSSEYFIRGINGDHSYISNYGRSINSTNLKHSLQFTHYGFNDGINASAPKMNFNLRRLQNYGQWNGFHWYAPNANSQDVGDGARKMWLSTNGTLSLFNADGPTTYTNKPDGFQMYSQDITAGNASMHIKTENGDVIKLYSQDNSIGSAVYTSNLGNSVTDADTFGGFTIRQIAQALINNGLLK